MSSVTLSILTLGLLFFGISLTIRFRLQADKEAFEVLCDYLRISRRSTVEELARILRENIPLKARQGLNILERLDGSAGNIDRDIVREALLQHTAHLPPITISPCDAKDWWMKFVSEWQMLHTHLATTLPAARRHISRTRE